MTFEGFAETARRMRASGASVEAVLLALRGEGASQGESMMALSTVEGGSIGDWKLVADSSAAWSDRFAGNAELRRELAEALENLDSSAEADGGAEL